MGALGYLGGQIAAHFAFCALACVIRSAFIALTNLGA